MSEKSPAFQFYPKDWLSDVKVISMTPAQRGIYIQLLCFMWLEDDCSLPSDTGFLTHLTNGLQQDVNEVKKCFYEVDGRIHQKRLCKEKEKQKEFKEKASKAGKKSAERRWGKDSIGNNDRYNLVTETLPLKRNSSSSSSEDIYIAKKPDEKPKKDRKKNFIPPSEEELIQYVVSKGYSTGLGRAAFEYYSTSNWKDSYGNQVNNWKQKLIANWFTEQNKQKYKSQSVVKDTPLTLKQSQSFFGDV